MTPEVFSTMKRAEIFIVRAQKDIDMRISGHPLHADQYRPGSAYVNVPVNTSGGSAAAAGILIVAAIVIPSPIRSSKRRRMSGLRLSAKPFRMPKSKNGSRL